MKWRIRNAILFSMAMGVLFGCSSGPKHDDRIVLKAGKQIITLSQLNWQYLGATFKSPEDEFQKKSAYLQRILDRKLIANIGLDLGLEDSVTIDSMTETQIIVSVAHQNMLRDRLKYTDEDLRKFWKEYGARLKAIQIVLETKSLADNVYSLVSKEPDKFSEYAVQYSMDERSKTSGGMLDTLRAGQMVWQFDDVVFKMKDGEVSKPFKTKFGWHIAKLVSRQESNPDDFAAEKATIESIYVKRVQDMMLEQFKEKIKKYEGFEVVDKTLSMMKNKLDSLQRVDRERGDSIRPFLRLTDLSESEAKLTLVKIKCSDFSAYDYVGNYKTRGVPKGIDLFDKDLIVQVAFQWRFGLASQFDAIRNKIDQTREYKEQIREVRLALVYRKLLEKISDTLAVSDQEARDYYEENKQILFLEPEKIRVSEILVNSETEANLFLEQLNKGTPFAKLVGKTIRPGMVEKQGDLGYLAMGDSGVIYDEAAKLGVGQFGGPVKSYAGYSVITVTDRTSPKVLPYEKFEAEIKATLPKEKLRDILGELAEERRKKDENFVDLELLKANLITGKLQNAN